MARIPYHTPNVPPLVLREETFYLSKRIFPVGETIEEMGGVKRVGTAAGLILTLSVGTYLLLALDWRGVTNLVLEADRRWVATFLLCSFVMSAGHAWRYLTLLSVTGYAVHPVLMYLVVLVRNLGSDLLPARLGTLIYVYLITKRLNVPLAAASASFGYALIFDFIAIAPLVLLASLFAIGNGDFSPATLALVGAGLGFGFAVLVALLPKISARAASSFARALSPRRQRLKTFLTGLDKEVQKTARAGVLGRVLVLSFMIRLSKYAGLYSFLLALMIPRGYKISDLPPTKVFLAMFAAELSASLPISGIAGIGAYQGVWIAAFAVLGFKHQLAAATSVGHHLFTQAYGYSLGLLAMGVLSLPALRALAVPTSIASLHVGSNTRFTARLVLFLTLISGAVIAVHAGENTPNGDVKTLPLSRDESELRSAFLADHRIVFDSNRSGTFGIYTIGGGELEPRFVVDTAERHEQFPSISPDGTAVAYASALGEGRYAESEIWIVSLVSGTRRRLSSNGTSPAFHPDGESVLFERDRSRVVSVSLENGQEREIFPAQHEPKFGRYQIVKPKISPDGSQIGFTTDRYERWRAYVVELVSGNLIDLGHGCQPVPLGDGRALFVKNRGARNHAGLYLVDLSSGKESELIDEGKPAGKEYFPYAVEDLFLYSEGSADGEHASFNIRALRSGRRIPITSDTASNRWPKLLSGPKAAD